MDVTSDYFDFYLNECIGCKSRRQRLVPMGVFMMGFSRHYRIHSKPTRLGSFEYLPCDRMDGEL